MTQPDADQHDDRGLWRHVAPMTVHAASGGCPSAGDVASYIDGGLDEGSRTRIETHLVDCGHCREAVASVRDILVQVDPPAIPGPAVVRRAQALRGPGRPPGRLSWPAVGRWAAAVAAGLIIAFGGLQAGGAASSRSANSEEAIRRELSLGLLNGTNLHETDALTGWAMVMEASR